jgi:hypothetical protein
MAGPLFTPLEEHYTHLLRVLPAVSESDQLVYELKEVSMEDEEEYVAVSFPGGNQALDHEITSCHKCV